MIDVLRFVVGLAADILRHSAGLVAENALLRQQLIVAQHASPRAASRESLFSAGSITTTGVARTRRNIRRELQSTKNHVAPRVAGRA